MAKSFSELFGPGLSQTEALRLLNMMHGPSYEQGDALQELIRDAQDSEAADILSERPSRTRPSARYRSAMPNRTDIPPERALARVSKPTATQATKEVAEKAGGFKKLAGWGLKRLPQALIALTALGYADRIRRGPMDQFLEEMSFEEERTAASREGIGMGALRDQEAELSQLVALAEGQAAGDQVLGDVIGPYMERGATLQALAAGREASLRHVSSPSQPSIQELYAKHGLL